MQRRRLGGLEVGAIGLGCATMTPFYGEPDPDAALATLMRAPDIGVDVSDGSSPVGRGRNHERFTAEEAAKRPSRRIAP
jgi:aryl-alcohol dehydrogenase-like predicted oxidoreductase